MANETMMGSLGNYAVDAISSALPFFETVHPWLFFLAMLAAAVILSQVVGLVVRWLAKVVTSRTKTKADDIFVKAIQQPISWLVFTIFLYIAVAPLALDGNNIALVNGIFLTLNILVAGWLFHRIAHALFQIWQEVFSSKTKSKLDDTMLPIMSKGVKAAIWVVAGLLVLSAWGITIGPFLAGLGIAGIAIGFAVQDSLANIFGGISLALDHAYKIGDKIRLQDGTLGVVHDISLRSTRIKTYDGDLIMVPNGKVSNENIYTFAQPAHNSRVQVDFGVEYGSDPDKVKKVVLKEITSMQATLKDPEPTCLFMSMGDFALEMRAYFWVEDYTQAFESKIEATKRIYKALNKAKIGIPFPTRTVYMKKA